jgi:ankyrin repeat protein
MKTILTLIAALLVSSQANAADELTAVLQQALFHEEADHDLAAAIKAYQAVVAGADAQRKLAATAVFRLGECYRKLGQTNDAVAQYQRIMRDFTDQTNLVALSRQNLIGLVAARTSVTESGGSASAGFLEAQLAATQAEASKARALVQQLEGRNHSELRRVLPTVAPDPLLTGLLNELALAVTKLTELSEGFSQDHPTVKAARNKIGVLHSQIDERITGILEGLKANADVLTRQSENLKRELANQPAARGTPGGVAMATPAQIEAHRLLIERLQLEIKTTEAEVARSKELIRQKLVPDNSAEKVEARLLDLRRQLILAQDAGPAGTASGDDAPGGKSQSVSPTAALTDEEERTLKGIKAIIRDSPDLINAKAINDVSRLQTAAESGHVRVAEFLLANGADVNANFGRRGTPLHLAAERGHKTMTELLLRYGADVNSGDSGGTPLHYAVENGHKAVAEVLLASKADVNAKGNGRRVVGKLTPLHVAVFYGFTTVAELLLASGAQMNSTDEGGDTPLHTAATYGHPRAAQLLLTNKAEVNARNNNGWTPLHKATHVRHQANPLSNPQMIARLLLEHQADVNSRIERGEYKGWTPLHLAAATTDQDMVELLLANKAEINAITPNSQTPLILAVNNSKADIVEALMVPGADLNVQTSDRGSALGLAVQKNDERIVSALLVMKPTLELRNKDSLTPLQSAVANDKEGMVELLLRAGANPNVVYEQYGDTPLHWAIHPKRRNMVNMLLAHKANPNARNNNGRTPLDLAKSSPQFPQTQRSASEQSAFDEIAALLRDAGADEQMQRRSAISVSRRSRDYLAPWFVQGSNTWNRFTLLELIASFHAHSPPVAFPDFTRVTISRLGSAGGKSTEIAVDVEALITSNDCSKDVPLEWGDVVEIPERDRKLNEAWDGLSFPVIVGLKKCLDRKVEIVVKGEPTRLTLEQRFIHPGGTPSSPQASPFWLGSTVRNANVLRASSDLRRVKVRRVDPSAKQPREIILNLERADPRTDLWLRDGDVIEVPEKDPNAPPRPAASAAAPVNVLIPEESSFRSIPSRSIRQFPPPVERK